MLGQSQGRGYASTEASVPALKVHSASLNCTNGARSGGRQPGVRVVAPDSSKTSMLADCPMCGKQPVEPVRVEGQMTCQGCTGACIVCGSACVPNDEVCSECCRIFGLHPWVVPA